MGAKVRDQCLDSGVPFFFKQWEGLRPKSGGRELDGLGTVRIPRYASAVRKRGRMIWFRFTITSIVSILR